MARLTIDLGGLSFDEADDLGRYAQSHGVELVEAARLLFSDALQNLHDAYREEDGLPGGYAAQDSGYAAELTYYREHPPKE